MELSFVIKALQRRWWVIVLFSLLGAIPGALLDDDNTTNEFQSDAVLLLSPPSTSETFNISGDPDRYVQGQLNVLQSLSLAEEVAEIIGDENAAAVRASTTFEQENDTDIVIISSTADNPLRAQIVVQAFVDAYIANQRESAQLSQQPDIQAFDQRLAEAEAELAAVNAIIDQEMQSFVALREGIPDINAVAPAEAAQRVLLIDEVNRIRTSKNDFELRGLLRVNTEVVQNASLPTVPVTSSNSILIVGGYIVGAMLGIVVALVWAQFSPYLIDEVSTSEVTGQPVVGTLGRSRVMRNNPLLASQQARGRTPQTLAQLAVRSEALGSVDRPLVIACVGPRLGAGATTTTLAMAGRFAQQGSLVTVLDADDRDRSLSRQHAAADSGGLARLVECIENETDVQADRVLTPTELGGVNVIGQGEQASALRRANARAVVQTAALFGDVLIIDGGPLLGSAAVIEACHHADAIVLAVPLQKQLRNQLLDVVTQLGPDRAKLLTVVNEPVPDNFFRRIFRRS